MINDQGLVIASPQARKASLHLFVQLYIPPQEEHLHRMLTCIASNARLAFVSAITVLSEGVAVEVQQDHVRVVPVTGAMTFASMLEHASLSCCSAATHFAIGNTDIQLTSDLEALLPKLDSASTAVALTRHEWNGSLYERPLWSQDLWVFRRHDPSADLLRSCDFRMGVAGCESLFAMALYAHGYDIWNPCLDCRVIHHDPAPRTDFPDRYHGAYLCLPECRLAEVGVGRPAYRFIVNRLPESPDVKSVDLTVVDRWSDARRDNGVRLHLCCGDKRLPGYWSVDIRREVQPDLRASVEDLGFVPSGSVSELYFCHGLEHVRVGSIEACLKGMWRILRPGGLLRMALPDFEALASLYVQGAVSLADIAPAIHGQQDYAANTHYWSWDFRSLADVLGRVGFVDISRYDAAEFLPGSYVDWSLHRLRDVPTSLNVLCRKPMSSDL